MRTRGLAVTLTAAIALTGCEHGGDRMWRDGPPPDVAVSPLPAELLKRFDADGSGEISRKEFEAVLSTEFALDDADGNGGLNVAEARKTNERLRTIANASPVLDWNADGTISRDEYAAQWLSAFRRADRNEDGLLTQAELTHPQIEPRGATDNPGGPPQGGRPSGGGRRGGGRPGAFDEGARNE